MHSVSIGQLEVAQDTKHLLSAPFRPAAMSFRQLPQLHIRVPSHVSSLSFSSQAQSEPQEQLVSNTTIIRLLDRTVEVENEVAQLQGPFLRDRFEDTDALGRPLLLCSWAQFHPILQYIQGQPLDLPHSKQQLRDLQKLAQRWELSGLDHIVRQRLRQQQGGCNPFKCFSSGGAPSADQAAASRSAGLAALLSSNSTPQHPQASRASQPRGTISNISQQQNEYRQAALEAVESPSEAVPKPTSVTSQGGGAKAGQRRGLVSSIRAQAGPARQQRVRQPTRRELEQQLLV